MNCKLVRYCNIWSEVSLESVTVMCFSQFCAVKTMTLCRQLQFSKESNQVKRIGVYRELVCSYLTLDIQNTLYLNFWALLMLGSRARILDFPRAVCSYLRTEQKRCLRNYRDDHVVCKLGVRNWVLNWRPKDERGCWYF